MKSKTLHVILEKENYTLINTQKNELYTTTNDTKIYQKNEILVLIYKYNNFQEVKNTIINNYKEELKNTLPIELTQEENYIQKKRCDDEFYSYELGYKKYLITCKIKKE